MSGFVGDLRRILWPANARTGSLAPSARATRRDPPPRQPTPDEIIQQQRKMQYLQQRETVRQLPQMEKLRRVAPLFRCDACAEARAAQPCNGYKPYQKGTEEGSCGAWLLCVRARGVAPRACEAGDLFGRVLVLSCAWHVHASVADVLLSLSSRPPARSCAWLPALPGGMSVW